MSTTSTTTVTSVQPGQQSTTARGVDAFHRLVAELSQALESSSGTTMLDVDQSKIEQLMSQYVSKESEWARYAFADASRGYTRNLVDAGQGKSNLLVLVWTPGKGSPIHDHSNAWCTMKVLSGRLHETHFAWPDQEAVAAGKDEPLRVTQKRLLGLNQITTMTDDIGLHRISNPDPTQFAVSLHLYTPPNAAKHGCHMFDEHTGQQHHVQQCHFYSEYGQKL